MNGGWKILLLMRISVSPQHYSTHSRIARILYPKRPISPSIQLFIKLSFNRRKKFENPIKGLVQVRYNLDLSFVSPGSTTRLL